MKLSSRLIATLVIAWAMPCASAQPASVSPVSGSTITGLVLDSAQKPISDASVWLESNANSNKVFTKTDAYGVFSFSDIREGKYLISAQKSGVESEVETVSASSSTTRESVKLTVGTTSYSNHSTTSSTNVMEFSDQPNFTVSGVTDWTAVGGHGSDAVLRTSEELAKDAATLKPESTGPPVNGNGDQHRLAGETAERSGDPLKAVHELEEAVRLDPSEKNYFEWGSELLLHRAVWQAVEVFENGSKAYPKSERMLAALGAALFASARYDEAALELCAASDLSPDNSDPYIFLGKIAIAAPTPLPCVEQKLARFAQRRPESSLANYFYAMAVLKRQVPSPDEQASQQVVALLNKAVELDAKCSDAWLQLGILSSSRHEAERTILYYKKAIEANPQSGEAHYRLAVAYDRIGKPTEAREQFEIHDEIEKREAEGVERERREIKQFLIVLQGQPTASPR